MTQMSLNPWKKDVSMKTMFNSLVAFLFGAALFILPDIGSACTDFIIKSQDNAYIIGRSMEFGQVLPMQIQIVPIGTKYQSAAPNHQKGVSWTSRYAYIGMVFKPANAVLDGFNEKGLSIGELWFPGAQYPPFPTGSPEKSLALLNIGDWLLGNFATVDEAKEGLLKVNIYAAEVPGFSSVPPIHLSIQDAKGKSAVVEFLNGKMNIFDNPIGVLTNAPELPWHLTNLRNYLNLSMLNAQPLNINGTVLSPPGQGSGMMGIPGDWTPPSRFVRTAIFKQALAPPKDAKAAILAAFHLLNTVDIPYGAIRATKNTDFDYTQWVVVKDLTNKQLYYRTYGNQNIQYVDFIAEKSQPKSIDLNTITP
jgi:choloylglycine hydrolase